MMRSWNPTATTPRGGPISPRNGRFLPALLDEEGRGPFVALGVAYALLGLGLVLFGSLRERAQAKALAEGGFAPLSGALVTAFTAYLTLLALATIALVLSV
jgi:hypothetical protein